ncbi:MFS transporter [Dinoroseobacter sp. S76]|uniref:MFS transporter n=1 Tax=Dinoroseobacter sp. S76 TaxID=3415124 RepID=UPI003C7B061C
MPHAPSSTTSTTRLPVWLPLIGPGLALISAASAMSLTAVTLPAIAVAFPGPVLDPNLVVTVFLLAITALLVPMGRAGDIFGARPVLATGLALFALGALWASSAGSLPALITARALQGIGASAMIGLPLALVRATVPEAQIGRWVGAMGTMSAIGTASGPALGGLLAGSFGWQAVFLIQIPMPVLALATTLLFLPRPTKPRQRIGLDLAGAGLLALVLTGGVLLVSDLPGGLAPWHLPGALGVGLGLALLLRHETRAQAPLIDLRLIRERLLALSLICNGVVAVIMMGILVVGPFFLILGLGLSPSAMGLCMAVGPVTSALSGAPAGALTERLGPARALIWGACGLCLGTLAMAGLPMVLGVAGFALAFVSLAIGYQIVQAALATGVMTAARAEHQGVTAGVFTLSRNIGFVLGASGMSALFAATSDRFATQLDYSGAAHAAMAMSFSIATMLALFVLLMAWRLRKPVH